MRNLWKHVPPFRADTFGFREIVNNTDGFGLTDDSSAYHGGAMAGGRRAARGCPSAVSEIRSEDVISGTKEKIMGLIPEYVDRFAPKFILLSMAPASSMIGTDMQDVADTVSQTTGLPAAFVDLNGHKTYDFGISETLTTMAKLLVKEKPVRDNTVNLIGGTAIDWGKDVLDSVQKWCQGTGKNLVSVWGAQESSENYQRAAEASVNLVATTSGLKMAKWMQTEFGTPYIAAAPFGKSWSAQIQQALSTHVQPTAQPTEGGPTAIFIGEQMMGNAFRATLQTDYGFGSVRVCSFFAMDKGLMQAGDKKLRGEEDLEAFLSEGEGCTIFGSPCFKYCKPENSRWIDLPCPGFLVPCGEMPALVGNGLNNWLNQVLR